VELEALRNPTAQVQDLVLQRVDGSSSLVMSLSLVVELLKGRIDVMAADRVHWGTQSVLADTLSPFPELVVDLELVGYGQSADLTKD
jgi:hypothetical protein